MSQKSKFEAKLHKTQVIKGKRAEDTRREQETLLAIEVERKRAEERTLKFMADRLSETTSRLSIVERDNASLKEEVAVLKEMLIRVGVHPQVAATAAVPMKSKSGLTPLHQWRMAQIRETGTFTDPTTKEGWIAIDLPEFWIEDEVKAFKVFPRSEYIRGESQINWKSTMHSPMGIAFNEFDIARMEDENFDVTDPNHIKIRWSTLINSKPLTGLTLNNLLKVYAKERGIDLILKKRGPKKI
jgi:hypothetical protein